MAVGALDGDRGAVLRVLKSLFGKGMNALASYLDKSEREQARIRRLPQREQEKYAQEAIDIINERGHGHQLGKNLEREFQDFGDVRSDKVRRRRQGR